MIKSLKVLAVVAVIGSLLTFIGCSKSNDNQPSASDQQLTKLSKTWKATAVTLNGTAQTGYTSFQLVITSTPGKTTFNYDQSTGRPTTGVWAKTGTFTFGTDVGTALIREDNIPISYSVSDTQLQMTFNYTGTGIAARVDQVQGNWVFTFGL